MVREMRTLFPCYRTSNSQRNNSIPSRACCWKNRFWLLLLLLIGYQVSPVWLSVQAASVFPVDLFSGMPRVAIISDMGNEPDDQMSFVRLLIYSNELDLEALIAATSTWQKAVTHPETMH